MHARHSTCFETIHAKNLIQRIKFNKVPPAHITKLLTIFAYFKRMSFFIIRFKNRTFFFLSAVVAFLLRVLSTATYQQIERRTNQHANERESHSPSFYLCPAPVYMRYWHFAFDKEKIVCISISNLIRSAYDKWVMPRWFSNTEQNKKYFAPNQNSYRNHITEQVSCQMAWKCVYLYI